MLGAALASTRAAAHAARVAPRGARALAAAPLAGAPRGALVVWGRIDDARLGMRFADDAFTVADLARPGGPAVGPTLLDAPRGAVRVVARAAKTLALTADGAVWSWGTCENLSLGHGEKVTRQATPRRVEALAGIRIVEVRAGRRRQRRRRRSAARRAAFKRVFPHARPPPALFPLPLRSTPARRPPSPFPTRARSLRGAGAAPFGAATAASGTATR